MPTPADISAVSSSAAAEYLGLCRQKVTLLLRAGLLPGTKTGTGKTCRWRVDLRPESRPWRTYPEAARLLDTDVLTIKRLVKQGELTVAHAAFDLALVDAAAVEGLLARQAAEPAPLAEASPEEMAVRWAAFQPHERFLRSFLHRHCACYDDAEDLLAELRLLAARSPLQADWEVHREWLLQRARMLLSTRRRSRERITARIGPILSLDRHERSPDHGADRPTLLDRLPDPSPETATAALGRLAADELWRAVRDLPERQQALALAPRGGLGMGSRPAPGADRSRVTLS